MTLWAKALKVDAMTNPGIPVRREAGMQGLMKAMYGGDLAHNFQPHTNVLK